MFVYLDASKMQCVIYRPDLYNLQTRKNLERYKQHKYNFPLTLFRMGFYGPPLPKICHISYNDETWHSYTLPKEDPKNI